MDITCCAPAGAPRRRALRTSLFLFVVAASFAAACSTPGSNAGTRVHAVTDQRLLWSPYSWVAEGDARMSPTVGAHLDVRFEGTSIGLEVDTTPLAHGGSKIVTSATIDGSEPRRVPLDMAEDGRIFWDGLSEGMHHVRFTVAKNGSIKKRWEHALDASLYITGIVADGPLVEPDSAAREAPTALFYGDSVVEGNGVDGLGVFGDNSFAAVAMNQLGYRYALHAYSGLTWAYSFVAHAGQFVALDPAAPQNDTTWMNYFRDRPMVTSTEPRRYLEGTPDLILNNLGANDLYVALDNPGLGRPSSEYLAEYIEAWLVQARAVAGPQTVIAMVMPMVYNCPEAFDSDEDEATRVLRAAYLQGIAGYADAHAEDERVVTIDLGEQACTVLLEQDHKGPHTAPETAQATGAMLASALEDVVEPLLR